MGWLVDGTTVLTESWVSGSPGAGGQLPGIAVVHIEGRSPTHDPATSTVVLEVPPAVGTYTFGPTSAAWATYTANSIRYYAGTAPGITTVPGAGTIVVTECAAGIIKGTFTFTGVEQQTGTTKTVANGKFYVPI